MSQQLARLQYARIALGCLLEYPHGTPDTTLLVYGYISQPDIVEEPQLTLTSAVLSSILVVLRLSIMSHHSKIAVVSPFVQLSLSLPTNWGCRSG